MSGIVALIHTDRSPVDPHLLGRMNDFMTFRGPDAQTIWSQDFVGFGHTMLRTTWESAAESQPFTIDRQVWIVADARIDDRQTLIEQLDFRQESGDRKEILTDVELILQAYLRWGDDCADRLLGDFAFVIWDDRQQRLFCARDHFGVKPFYYSQVNNCLLISNTLDCLRQHPQVSSKLNERTIGDLLLFDMNYDLETTAFADIQRLPAAHTFTWSSERGVQTRRYWTMPVPELIRYANPQDYLDRFQELMGQSVGDRLRTDRVASFFSGGLDSTTIAATALAVAKQRSQPLDLKAFSIVYDTLIPDRERYYAGLAADKLGMAIDYQVADNYDLNASLTSAKFQLPEPSNNPLQELDWDSFRRVSAHSRVVLCGDGGDESLTPTTVREMIQTMSLIDVGLDVSRSLFGFGVKPHWGSGLLGRMRRWRQPERKLQGYPTWLNPDFVRSMELAQRWSEIKDRPKKLVDSPRSPAYHKSTSMLWAAILEYNDPGYSGIPVEVRLPFIDLRLLNYLLALPPTPWCVDKMLMRAAMKDILPTEVRLRPKTPLAGDPLAAKGLQSMNRVSVSNILPAIESYVNIGGIYQLLESINSLNGWEYWEYLIPISFAYWFDRHLDVVKDDPLQPFPRRHDTS
ncbi:asparagine synthase-related protein [Chamaesiphon sp. VAR_48_metabat_135_sub]|uniref:asparagine synthetase B family protein n=1 Tax=Chamaesiphon sp. VAR_48_metabat_135_sub TaxID=2964699 RepID=UPI00286A2669|nr:asparagine synthase-related protein [Chamaesiphon sp. VAR_48_metabat_135_sub]